MKKYAISFFLLFSFIFCSPVFGMDISDDFEFNSNNFFSDEECTRIPVSTDKKKLLKECIDKLSPFFDFADQRKAKTSKEETSKAKKRKAKKRKLSEGSKNIMNLPYDCIGYLLLYLPQGAVIHKISLVNKFMNHYITEPGGYWCMKNMAVMTIRPSSFDNNDKLKSCFGFDSIYSHKDVKRIHLKIKCNEKSSDNQAEQNIKGGSEMLNDSIPSLSLLNILSLRAKKSSQLFVFKPKKDQFHTKNSGFIENLKKLVNLKELADKVVCFSFYSFKFAEVKRNSNDLEIGVISLSKEDEEIIILGKKYFKEFKNLKAIFLFDDDCDSFSRFNLLRLYDLSYDIQVFSNYNYNKLKHLYNDLINHDGKVLSMNSEYLNNLLKAYKDKDPNIIYTSKMKST